MNSYHYSYNYYKYHIGNPQHFNQDGFTLMNWDQSKTFGVRLNIIYSYLLFIYNMVHWYLLYLRNKNNQENIK